MELVSLGVLQGVVDVRPQERDAPKGTAVDRACHVLPGEEQPHYHGLAALVPRPDLLDLINEDEERFMVSRAYQIGKGTGHSPLDRVQLLSSLGAFCLTFQVNASRDAERGQRERRLLQLPCAREHPVVESFIP